MEQFGLALLLFGSFWVGALAGWLAMRQREASSYERGRSESIGEIASLKERIDGREALVADLRKRLEAAEALEAEMQIERDRRATAEARAALIPKYESELESRGARIMDLTQQLAQASARAEAREESSAEKITGLTDLQEQLGATFRAMSAEALATALTTLQEAAQGDLSNRQAAIGEMVKPLKEQLEKVDTRIHEIERERAGVVAAITQQVDSLVKSQQTLQNETRNLVYALRTPAARGRWGEVQLRRVVEMAGMVEHCDFETQQSVETEEGRLRPDLIVKLPNQRQIVVDAKVSLAAYLESLDAADELARIDRMKLHAAQVRAHLDRLSGKQYWDQFPHSPEFVVAFLPGETFFSAALEQDPGLVEYGVERRVILATPTTLIALLKAIAYGWRQEQLSANAAEIRDLGKSLYERVRTMAEHLTDLRRNIEKTNQAFNKTVGAMEARVLPAARRFRELGAGSGDEVPVLGAVESTPRELQTIGGQEEW